jgi:prepilin-type N-terminal cleavage/methylation domain-containing protein
VSRRGFSLFEVMIALALTGIVGALSWSILQTASFRLRNRSERMGMEHALRVAAVATRGALESLGQDSTAGTDLASLAPDGFIARAVRGSGVLCAAGSSSLTLRAGPDWWHGLRAPVAGRDSLLVGTIAEPARWVAVALRNAPSSGTCPDGRPALVLGAALSPTDLAVIGPGSPLRVFEHMELRAYPSSGATWLGLRSVSSGGVIQPLAGPFAGAAMTLRYFSRTGADVMLPGAVSSAGWTISGITERMGGIGMARVPGLQSDSGGGSVQLRNTP